MKAEREKQNRQRQGWETKRDWEADKWKKRGTMGGNSFSLTLGHTPKCIGSVWFIESPLKLHSKYEEKINLFF